MQEEPCLEQDVTEKIVYRAARRAYFRVGLGLLLFACLPTLLAYGISLLLSRLAPAALDLPYISWIAQVVLMYGIAFPISFFVVGRPRQPLHPQDGKRFPAILLLTVFCLLFAVARVGTVISNILTVFSRLLLGAFPDNPLTEMLSDTPIIIIFAVVAVLGPIVEELLLRYAVMERLLPFGEKSAILFSAVAFGLLHGNFYQLFYSVGIGLLLGYLYARTRKVLYPILLHVLFNFLGSVVPLSFAPLIEQLGNGELSLSFLVQNAAPLAAMLFYLLLQMALPVAGVVLVSVFCKRIRFCPAELPLGKRAHTRACLANAGVILFAVVACLGLALSLIP